MNLFNVSTYAKKTLIEQARELTEKDFDFTVQIATPTSDSDHDYFHYSGVRVGIRVTALPKAEVVVPCDHLFLDRNLFTGWDSRLSCDHPFRSNNPFYRMPNDCKDWGYPGKSWKELNDEEQCDVATKVRKLKTFTSSESEGHETNTYRQVNDFRGCRNIESRRRKAVRVHEELRAKFEELGGVEAAKARCVDEANRWLRSSVARLNNNAVSWLRRQFGPDTHPTSGWQKEYIEGLLNKHPEIKQDIEEEKFIEQQIAALQERRGRLRARSELATAQVIWEDVSGGLPEAFLKTAEVAHDLRVKRLQERAESGRGAVINPFVNFGGD